MSNCSCMRCRGVSPLLKQIEEIGAEVEQNLASIRRKNQAAHLDESQVIRFAVGQALAHSANAINEMAKQGPSIFEGHGFVENAAMVLDATVGIQESTFNRLAGVGQKELH